MLLTYKYRLLPNKRQHRALEAILESQRQLYNAALQERIDCYQKTGRTLSCFDQYKEITICRRDLPEMAQIHWTLQRWSIKKLDEAYKLFFRRLKAKSGKAGFPRFRSLSRWNSFGFAEFYGVQWDGKRLRFKGMPGGLRVHLHRPLPKYLNIRSYVFTRDDAGWCVCFQVKVLECRKKTVSTSIGIDLGLKVFPYASDGVVIPNPRIARRSENKLRRCQRALSRCKWGSKRHLKTKVRLTKAYKRVTNSRRTWLHQQSAILVNRADLIVAENLNVKGMARHPTLAKSISDVSWSTFLSMIAYKAERAGKHFIKVDPKNTSQRCSGCGELVPKSLAVRTHSCPHCNLTIDRDWNASINILQAVVGLEQHNVAQWSKRVVRNLKLVT